MRNSNNDLKIGFLHYSYPPIVGGVENLIRLHARLFADNGNPVTIFTSSGEERDNRIKLKNIPEVASLDTIDKKLRTDILTKEDYPDGFHAISNVILDALIENTDTFDVLIVHNVFSLTFNPCIAYALRQFISQYPNKKIIAWTHDFILNNREVDPEKKEYLNKDLEKMMYTPLNGVHYVAISEFLKNTMTSLFEFKPEDISVIHNGIDIGTFLNLHPVSQNILAENDLLTYQPLLFFPAKIMPHKNIELCLESVSELKKRGYNPLLVISARGFPHNAKSKDYLETVDTLIDKLEIKSNILMLTDFLNDLTTSEIMRIITDFYLLSDIILYPSKYENFGLPLIEAGIAKTPIICSSLNVFNEVSDGLVTNIDYKSATGLTLSNLIQSILHHNTDVQMFQRVKKRFDIHSIFKNRLLPFIEKI